MKMLTELSCSNEIIFLYDIKSLLYLVESGGIETGGFDPREIITCVTNFLSQ